MLRYQRLGVLVDGNTEITGLLRDLPTPENEAQLKKRIKDIDTRLVHTVSTCVNLAWYKHAQYDFPVGSIETYLSYALPAAIEYFYGDYREKYQKYMHEPPYNRETSRIYLPWVNMFCMSVFCSLLMNDQKTVCKISTYLGEDLIESWYNDCHKSDMWFCILLGKFLCGESLEKNKHILDIIRGHSRKRPKLLLDILESIAVNPKEFGRKITLYVKYFIKHEINKTCSSNEKEVSLQRGYFSIMASVLWETARFFDRTLPELPDEIMDRIITQESLGLTTPHN